MSDRGIVIGSRGSALALAQAETVSSALCRLAPATRFSVEIITTRGDRKQGTSAAAAGDKKDWIFEIEEAIVDGRIDLAVHCGKDVPVDINPQTELTPLLSREMPEDVVVLREAASLDGGVSASGRLESLPFLPFGAAIGTASLRRRAQLLRLRPDLLVEPVRGNIHTRIDALQRLPHLFGVVLASAGLRRLGDPAPHVVTLPIGELIPAVHQGILVAQYRADRPDLRALVTSSVVPGLPAVWHAERACLTRLEADCASAVGIYARYQTSTLLELSAQVLEPSGREALFESRCGPPDLAEQLGTDAAESLLARGARAMLHLSA